ncbi:hypothetical protein KBZ10_27445 [Streptomyces sp. F63]|uniref:hypothetical protein n=1 Tax=Streptomyces sp. F63 TaxID=2824887 RepID=UPI001B35E6B6|nr:hypothetical protein [Streptomyces sp. F63]MBQ0988181.1 hypothetical protein [Streptomyces sp. F63]
MSSCSSDDPARAEKWQQEYCTKLGAWQDAKRAAATSGADVSAGDERDDPSSESDDVGSAGQAAITASERLVRGDTAHRGGTILDDTSSAVAGDIDGERRAVSYCDSAGFETLVDSAG